MITRLTRRRFLTISAVAAGLGTSPLHAGEVIRWQGQALGAKASMKLVGLNQTQAQPVLRAVEQELNRLELIFSLYRPDSEISRLNKSGHLPVPSAEMLDVLSLSAALNEATKGAFDPTVQPLWVARAQGDDIDAAQSLVGWRNVTYDTGAVQFARPGMGLTLNGIAQGFITDRIATYLRAQGLDNILIDMGEIVAMGGHQDGRDWQAGIARPDGTIVRRVALRDRGLATSAPFGTALPANSGFGHIIDPKGKTVPPKQRLASVSAPKAAVADGLSTACCLLDRDDSQEAVAQFPGAAIELLT